jgi:hypothetical protein
MPVERILEAMKAMEESTILLPHYGAQLCELVQVLLTSAKANEDREMIETLIATAVVRRRVVVLLIELLVDRKHRGYARVNLAHVRARALQLPEHGIPDGLLPLQARKQPPRDVSEGKGAVPADPNTQHPEADVFEFVPATGVQSDVDGLAADVEKSTLNSFVHTTMQAGNKKPHMEVRGGDIEDMFKPTFFLYAHAFLFPNCVGAPDPPEGKGERDIRTGPRVELGDWGALLMEHASGSFARDITLPFGIRNMVLRTEINLKCRLGWLEGHVDHNQYTAEDIDAAVESICTARGGTYVSDSGRTMPTNGNMGKMAKSAQLTPLAKRMMTGMAGSLKNLEGMNQIRVRVSRLGLVRV